MGVPTNLHSLALGAAIAGALALSLIRLGLAFGAPDPAWMPAPDWDLGTALGRAAAIGLAHLALFSLGHAALRQAGLGRLPVYAALGAAAFLAAFGIVLPAGEMSPGLGPRAWRLDGIVLGTGTVVGALYWLHARYAGRRWRKDRAA